MKLRYCRKSSLYLYSFSQSNVAYSASEQPNRMRRSDMQFIRFFHTVIVPSTNWLFAIFYCHPNFWNSVYRSLLSIKYVLLEVIYRSRINFIREWIEFCSTKHKYEVAHAYDRSKIFLTIVKAWKLYRTIYVIQDDHAFTAEQRSICHVAADVKIELTFQISFAFVTKSCPKCAVAGETSRILWILLI